MASTSSVSADEIQLTKEVSSVQMDHVSIDAEMKKDFLEADIADSPLVMATNKNYVLYMEEKGGSSLELQSDPFIYEEPQKAEFYMERDLLEELGTAEKGESSPLLQLNFMNHDEYMPSCVDVNARMDRDQGIRESVIVDESPSVIATNMNPELYKAVKGGNIAYIQEIVRDMECSLLLETSPKLNTILHVAASSGHDELVKVILQTKGCQELVRKKNSTDNLALHVAASVGHLPIVKLLLSSYQQLEESRCFGQLREQNKEGNTPLHVALINKYQNVDLKMKRKYHEVASFLVEMDPEVSHFQVNEENKSPLYMVAEAGDVELLKLMMNKLTRLLYVAGKAIVHAAIYGAFTTKNLGNFLTSF